ncbi:hypothetical protein FS935_11410 [Metabacillus litoralis]|uniref:Uncharacterized protein n=1 Tax=Metabacillus litoralis TaxID=152268 RepID=A0A5C6W0U3_9BACI|nr:hypothetical protein [Metabacillus litoralis]TXC90522.1 hypothetical protein FS935_11410 [Metabacillus litoralis]
MQILVVFLVIILSVFIDIYWLDTEGKRWGWIRSWSALGKLIFCIGFVIVSGFIYLGLSGKYL